MAKEEIKAVQEILSNKKKFRRVIIIIIIVCLTIAVISGVGFYTGAITWHAGNDTKIERNNDRRGN